MSIPKYGNVILSALRANVGGAGAGQLMDRPTLNQINKTGGPVSFDNFRGAINGTQRDTNPTRDTIYRHLTNQALYLNAYAHSSVSVNAAGVINTTCYVDSAGFSEGGAEWRMAGIVPAGANRIVASASSSGDVIGTDSGAGFGQLSLIYSTGGWLSGFTEVMASEQGPNSKSYSLDSGNVNFGSDTYITLIGYAIVYEGYGQEHLSLNWQNAIMRHP